MKGNVKAETSKIKIRKYSDGRMEEGKEVRK
jgi:hypothetical protein